jgi:hypothetical protein
MKTPIAVLILIVGVCSGVPRADAAPVQLTQAEFNAATAGLTTVVEDFEGFPPGNTTDPFTFANGTITIEDVFVPAISENPDFCGGAGGDNCLIGSIGFLRTISALPAGTTLWAVTDFVAVFQSDTFEITVTGNSGSFVMDLAPATFFGFSDPTGLISISFENLGSFGGGGNYALDDIVTAQGPAPAPVPEPTSLSLLGFALAGIGARHWRQRKA